LAQTLVIAKPAPMLYLAGMVIVMLIAVDLLELPAHRAARRRLQDG
jgi:hypothetical protein